MLLSRLIGFLSDGENEMRVLALLLPTNIVYLCILGAGLANLGAIPAGFV